VRSQLIGTVQAMPEDLLSASGVKVRGLPYHPDEPFWQVIASMSYAHIQGHITGLSAALAEQSQPAALSGEKQPG
jgi:hypothetical protein